MEEVKQQAELTQKLLDDHDLGGIIAKGTGLFKHLGEGKITWIAFKVHSGKWTIHYDDSVYYDGSIVKYGHVLLDKTTVKELVPCTTEVLQAYRI